jgi:hypothetical protein
MKGFTGLFWAISVGICVGFENIIHQFTEIKVLVISEPADDL